MQLILDARILHQMFPHTRFVEAVETLQSKMDPFECQILDSYLALNARIAVKRCTVSLDSFLKLSGVRFIFVFVL